MAQHYEVAVVGTQPAAIIAAALLAKRGRRVLLLDHGENATTYGRHGYRLPLAPGLVPQLESSPPMQRVHEELGLGPELRSATRPLSPAFQAVLPRHRFDIHPDPKAMLAEVAQEFPREAPAVGAFLTRLFATDDELSALLREGLPVMPGTLGERWQARGWRGKASAHAGPFEATSWLAGLPASHPLHEVLLTPLAFFGFLAGGTPTVFQAVRLLARYLRGVVEFTDRLGGLPGFLLKAARQAGVEVRQGAVVSAVGASGRSLAHVEVAGDKEPFTAEYFIAGTIEPFQELLPAKARNARFAVEEQSVRPTGSLLVTNLVVDEDVIPCGMAQALFVLNGRREPRGDAPADPPLLLQRYPALRKDGRKAAGDSLEVISIACPVRTADLAHSPDRLAALKEQVLARVGRLVPFLGEHVKDTSLAIDTGGWDVEGDGTRRIDPWRLHPLYETGTPPILGVAARSPRTYFKNLWHCGRDVVPGLGIEGDYVTGLAVADGIIDDAGRRWARRG